MGCKCLDVTLAITNDVAATVSCDGTVAGSVAVGPVAIRDGTNDYNRLVNLPSIEGHTLKGDSTLPQIGVGDITPQEIDQIIYG